MANRKSHMVTGAVVMGGLNLAWQLHKIYTSPEPPSTFGSALSRINLLELGAFAVAGAFVGCLPDILEPATSPNHRNFFHSVTCGGGLLYGAFGDHSEQWPLDDRIKVRSIALSYLSHLFLDAGTPKGLPPF